MSRTMPSKSAVASGWKTIAASPVVVRPSSISSLTYAVDMANSRSAAGCLSSRLPRRMSKSPTPKSLSGDAALELRLQALQGGDALLHRRVRGEQLAEPLADARREDEERVHLARRAQVLLRDPVHAGGDLHQRAGQCARAPGDERGAAVGRVLAVARERLHEEERDDVDRERDQQQHDEAGAVV